VMAVLVNLLYVYASLPEDVVVQDDLSGRVVANREFLFYTTTLVLTIINVMVYLVGKLYPKQQYDNFRAWFHGLIITMNGFFIVAMNLVQVYNGLDKYDYSHIGFIIYGSVLMVVVWAVSWPLYSLFRKFFTKEIVI
jgi:hypothetical protein